jgi:serine/threonine protein phosphatase 1
MAVTFAIGDIHGHLTMLDSIITQISADAEPGDTLLFVGDYIDRGPDSRGVIDRVLELRQSWAGPVVTLCGNHEDMMLDHLRDHTPLGRGRLYDLGIWEVNGGVETLASYVGEDQYQSFRREFSRLGDEEMALLAVCKYGLANLLPDAHLAFFTTDLKLTYEDEHAHYVHAGFWPGKRPAECSRAECLWVREEFLDSPYTWDKPVVFGHTPQRRKGSAYRSNAFAPRNEPMKLGIDTGSCYSGYLTAVRLPDRKFYRSH